MKERCSAAYIVEQLLRVKKVHKKDIAFLMGMDSKQFSSFLNKQIRFDEMAEIASQLGFDIIFKPTTDSEGMVKVQTVSICDGCKYIKFADALEDAIKNLHANLKGAGVELDFYTDEVPNPETEINFPTNQK